MRGVVIWYSRVDFKALIWCEDSREIAVAKGATAWRNPMVPVDVGDFVSFVSLGGGTHRLCRDIQKIAAQVAPDLTASLRAPHLPPKRNTQNRHLHLCQSRD